MKKANQDKKYPISDKSVQYADRKVFQNLHQNTYINYRSILRH